MKLKNAVEMMDNTVSIESFTNRIPQQSFFRSKSSSVLSERNYNMIKCKFCEVEFKSNLLKYKLSAKMILETELILKHIGINLNIPRSDLSHVDASSLYLPYRVCEEW